MARAAEVLIKGQRELEAALLEVRREVLAELKPAVAALSEPVRGDAQQRAGADIANIGPKWQRMKIGITTETVYVAPRTRSRNRALSRPNLATLLELQMQAALEDHQEAIVHGISELVDVTVTRNGFTI